MKPDETYLRIARMAVDTYGHAGTFEFEPMTLDDLEPLADAFCEIGCAVTEGARGLTVTVRDREVTRVPIHQGISPADFGLLL